MCQLNRRQQCALHGEEAAERGAKSGDGSRTIWSSDRLMTFLLRVKKPLFHVIRSSFSSICRLLPSPSQSDSYSPSLEPPMLA